MGGWMGEWVGGWMGKLGYSNQKSLITESMGGWMDGWRESWVTAIKKAWLLNRWVDEWMGGIKLNYNGGPFSKMVRFLKFKFLIILKLNYNGGQFYKK